MSQVRRALISVSNKQDLIPFARALTGLGFELISTAGTARALREAGLAVTEVSELTGFPEIMDGRVKTLHPHVHGGLLARRGVDDAVLDQHGIGWIDLLVVNLYPFEETIAETQCTDEAAIENIDVGGPAMLRAAAKNHARVTVVVSSADYDRVLEAFSGGEPAPALKRELAAKAFRHTAHYDAVIARYLGARSSEAFPDPLVMSWRLAQALRYGENPHQKAALYRSPEPAAGAVAAAAQLQGKPLSFNNLLDADTALLCVKAFAEPACVIVKHANPCGVAIAATLIEAYRHAYRSDPTSAFGGVIAFNRDLDAECARSIVKQQLVDAIIAPEVGSAALAALGKKPNIRVLEAGALLRGPSGWELRTIDGGLLLQERDCGGLESLQLKVVSARAPTPSELEDLRFAWTVAQFVKSNAIVYAHNGHTVGIGAGQMSRVISARIAAMKAQDEGLELQGAVMASDAFFPFRDGIDIAAQHGIAAVIHPGGSVRDEEVVRAADEHGLAMVMTGVRHFRH